MRKVSALGVIVAVVLFFSQAWAFSPDPGIALSQKCSTMDDAVVEAAAMNKGCSDISTLVFVHICKGQMMDGKPVTDDKTLGNTKVCSHPANDPRYAVLTQAFWFLGKSAVPNTPITITNSYFEGNRGNGINIGGSASDALPQALGPYPTEAMCKEAEHVVNPSNQKFWGLNELAAQDRYDSRLAQLAKENPKDGIYRLWDGTYFQVTDGKALILGPDVYYSWAHDGRPRAYPAPGKSIPPKPEVGIDTYIVDQECQSVSGWYRSVSISGAANAR